MFRNPLFFSSMMKRLLLSALCTGTLAFAGCAKSGDGKLPDDPTQGLEKTVYTYDDAAILNPERGWFIFNQFNFKGGNTPAPLTEATVKAATNRGISLIHTIYYLFDYVDKPLSQAVLDTFEANMQAIRAGGAKCVLRFAYSDAYDVDNNRPAPNSDATFEVMQGHIAQLKPLLQKYGDVIFVVQAGFIGAWGEWYYTDNYGFQPQTAADYLPRRKVMDLLLDAVPKDRMIGVRYPDAKLMMYGLQPADSVTSATAFNESDLSRIAMHNDCFVSSNNDVGTFFNDAQRDFWQTESRYLLMGGETCAVSAPYSGGDNALAQMANYHWSYLNSNYNTDVIAGWRRDGVYDEITNRLGYRLSLTEAYFTKEPAVTKPFEIVLFIQNDGFAAPMNPRDAEIVFVDKSGSAAPVRIKTDADPRRWYAGQTHEVKLSLDISALAAGKTYGVYLNLPDPEPDLNTRPEYSIRLADKNMWDAQRGYNKLCEIAL